MNTHAAVTAVASDAARISAVLERAARALSPHSESPRLDAEVMLAHVMRMARTGLIVHAADVLPDSHLRALEELLERRIAGAPVAYLTGIREFWSMELNVTPDVLVPRPETEVLVELALGLMPVDASRTVLDLGTGSGAVALAIAAERPRARVTGVDVTERALAVARSNSRKFTLTNIEWRKGSWFTAVPAQRFDLIVANPPYVASGDPALRQLSAEPPLALTPGPTGHESLEHIIASASDHLEPHGWLLLEHGSTQADAVAALLTGAGFGLVSSHADYAGRLRVTRGTIFSHTLMKDQI